MDQDSDRLVVNAPTPAQYRTASGADKILISGPDEQPRRPPAFHIMGNGNGIGAGGNANGYGGFVAPLNLQGRVEPPPLPSKTPLPEHQRRPTMGYPVQQQMPMHQQQSALPYPVDDDGPPPPVVNMARKPNYAFGR